MPPKRDLVNFRWDPVQQCALAPANLSRVSFDGYRALLELLLDYFERTLQFVLIVR